MMIMAASAAKEIDEQQLFPFAQTFNFRFPFLVSLRLLAMKTILNSLSL
jgi:hypothetical protein